jgi:hypothetical protein
MDRLEEYIKKNRDDLDIYLPSPGLWRRIRTRLNSDKYYMRRWISVAASVAILITTSVIFYQIGKGGRIINGSYAPGRGITIVNSQLKEAETFYNNQINQLYREVAPLLTGYPELETELNSDISRMDSIYADLRKDLKDNIANQEVVEALIQNYLIKVKILEDMLVILKEDKNYGEKDKSYGL